MMFSTKTNNFIIFGLFWAESGSIFGAGRSRSATASTLWMTSRAAITRAARSTYSGEHMCNKIHQFATSFGPIFVTYVLAGVGTRRVAMARWGLLALWTSCSRTSRAPCTTPSCNEGLAATENGPVFSLQVVPKPLCMAFAAAATPFCMQERFLPLDAAPRERTNLPMTNSRAPPPRLPHPIHQL